MDYEMQQIYMCNKDFDDIFDRLIQLQNRKGTEARKRAAQYLRNRQQGLLDWLSE